MPRFRALALMMMCVLGAAPLAAQSFQSAFSEPVFDTAKAPKNIFGDVQVDPATGHVSMQIPLGPGIGARGAVYRPMITLDQTYNHYIEDTTTNPALDGIGAIQQSCVGASDFSQGGACAEVLNQTDTTVSNGMFRFSPGTLDLAIPHGYQGEDNSTRFRVGALSGVANYGSVLPGNSAATDPFPAGLVPNILTKFGYPTATQPGQISSNPNAMTPGTSYFCTLASDRYLIMAVPGSQLSLTETWNFNPANWGSPASTSAPLTYPQKMLVVDGDTAYEFTAAYALDQERATIILLKPYNEHDFVTVSGALHIRYRLSKVLNAFGDEVRFTYTPAANGAIYTIGAEWWRNPTGAGATGAVDTGVGVTWTFNPASGSARYTVAYQGLGQSLSYTLAAASKSLGTNTGPSMPLRMDQPDGSQLPPAPAPPASWFDTPASPANYAYIQNYDTLGINQQEETLWNVVPLDAITQDQTHEQMAFGVSAFGTGAFVAYGKDGQPYTRATVLHWSGEYDFLDTRGGPFADHAFAKIGHSRTVGVTQVDELAAGPHGTITRSTTYDRTVPKPQYTDYVRRPAPDDGCYALSTQPTGGAVLMRNLSMNPTQIMWQSTAFTCTVTHFDGRKETYTYTSPNLSESGTDWVAFVKALPVQEKVYAEDGTTLEKTIAYSNYDVHTLGNPGGQGAVPVPVATHWEIQDALAGRWEIHDLSPSPSVTGVGWDATNLGWTGEQLLIKDLNGSLIADRTMGKTLTSHLAYFLYAQDQADTPVDPTVRVPVARSGFDSKVNLSTTATYGDASGQQVALHTDWVMGTGLLTDAWVDYPGVSTPAYGAKYTYDTNGFMNSITPIDPSFANLKVQQTSNGVGWPMSQTDPNALTRTFTWDGAGRLAAQALPNSEYGHAFTYDPAALTVRVDHGVQTETHVYNGFGEPIRIVRTNGDGTTQSHKGFGYDTDGHLTWETGWLAGDGAADDWTAVLAPGDTAAVPAWTEVTSQCAAWSVPDMDGNRTCLRYRTIDHPEIPAVYKNTHYEYDTHSRVTKVTSPNQEITTTVYAAMNTGSTKTVTLAPTTAAQQQQINAYDPLGRLVKVTAVGDTASYDSVYTYDNADRVKSVTQWSGLSGTGPSQVRTWTYDTLGRLTTLVQPESGTTTYSAFLPTGKPTTTVYGSGSATPKTLTTGYDTQGRITSVSSSDSSVTQSFSYDQTGHGLANGKLTNATNNGVGRSLTYSGLNGRLSSLVRTVDGKTFTQSLTSYDAYGNLLSRTYPDGKIQKLAYNAYTGLPASAGFGTSPTTSDLVNTLGYDQNGWMLNQISYANAATSSFTYRTDQVGLLTMTHTIPGKTLAAWTFSYNEAGQLGTDGEDWYSYDKLGRLTQAFMRDPANPGAGLGLQQTFAYDAFGNRKGMTSQKVTNWTAPAAPPGSPTLTGLGSDPRPLRSFSMTSAEITTMGATNHLPTTLNGVATGSIYDAQGNLTAIYGNPGTSASLLTMTYDALGRVATLGDTAHSTSQTYGFDDEGLRIKSLDSATGLVKYNIYDEGRKLIAQYEVPSGGSLTWKKDLVYVGAKEVAEVDGSHTWVEFVDHLGSPRFEWDGVASPVAGTDLISQKYAPFGEYLNDAVTAAKFGKGFTNHEQTDASGLVYMQARFYAPMYGRFLSPDPARDQHFEQTQSWNIYSYAQNDPTMRIDPTGQFGVPNWLKATGSYLADSGRALGGYGIGLGKTVVGVGKGVGTAVAHPIQTAKGIGHAVAHPVATAKGIGGAVSDAWSNANTPQQMGEFIGRAAGEAALIVAPFAKGAQAANLGKAGEVGDVANSSAKASEASSAVSGLNLQKQLASEAQMSEAGTSMAGAGGRTTFRDADRAASTYGGDPGDYAKMTSSNFEAKDGTRFETHWVENTQTGEQFEHKTKIIPKDGGK